MITLSTNVSAADGVRIKHTIPSWLRSFPEIAELLVVVDEVPPAGRIGLLHRGYSDLSGLYGELDRLQRSDSRVRIIKLTMADAQATLSKWFGDKRTIFPPSFRPPRPIRCQAGTPVFAFLQAIEAATGRTVLRSDCDMLFFNNGWLTAAERLLEAQEMDFVEPARLGDSDERYRFSSRAFVVDRQRLSTVLPLHAHVLDPLRTLKRLAMGLPPWLALEQTIERERASQKLRAAMLPETLGFSLHVATHREAGLDWFGQVPPLVERGILPHEQRSFGHDFCPAAWQAVLAQPNRFNAG